MNCIELSSHFDYEGSLFSDLQVLPRDKEAITSDPTSIEVTLRDIAKEIRQLITTLREKANAEINKSYQEYCQKLHSQWKMLDFRGIQYTDKNRPVSIPPNLC